MVRKTRSGDSASNGHAQSNGTRVVDPEKVRSFMYGRSLSLERLAEVLEVSVHTVERMLSGKPVRPRTAADVAARMAIPVTELLLNGNENGAGLLAHSEWEAIEQVTDWTPVSAGIQCRIHRLRHRFLPETYARRKCYRIRNAASREEKQLREYFLRHPKIVRRLRACSYFPANHGVFGESDGRTWWIIDEWIAGHTLQAALDIGPVVHQDLPGLFHQIAEALQVLHRAVIIRRCLSPGNIIIRDTNRSIVLTDLELSKLSDGSPTVKNHVQENSPYVAPEVGVADFNLDLSADVYSWGRIYLHAACGVLPDHDNEAALVDKAGLSSAMKALVLRCVALDRRERPKSMDEVLCVITRSV